MGSSMVNSGFIGGFNVTITNFERIQFGVDVGVVGTTPLNKHGSFYIEARIGPRLSVGSDKAMSLKFSGTMGGVGSGRIGNLQAAVTGGLESSLEEPLVLVGGLIAGMYGLTLGAGVATQPNPLQMVPTITLDFNPLFPLKPEVYYPGTL